MPHLVLALAVASLNLTPLADAASSRDFTNGPHQVCGSQMDPRFVRFVKEAPSSPHNPLLRWVSAPDSEARNASRTLGGRDICKTMLTRFDFGR